MGLAVSMGVELSWSIMGLTRVYPCSHGEWERSENCLDDLLDMLHEWRDETSLGLT